ncbi:MAG: argS [Chlamydiales bacterium]|jgi:arginyl-tRNA synthetase|nr:argS [Chlamydiales bacterium]
MESSITLLGRKFAVALELAFPQLSKGQISQYLEIAPSTQPQFGHYQYNSAMKLAKVLGMPPRKIAEQIVPHFTGGSEIISQVEIAGPGFINITLSSKYLAQRAFEVLSDDRLGIPIPDRKQKVVIDFSSPNTAKELHVGHLRSTIIGDCLARLFEFLGHDVLRLNHVGDWGTPFGMLIAYMQEQAADVLHGRQAAHLPDLVRWYKEAKARLDTDPVFKEKSHQAVVKLQGGDSEYRKAWEMICEISRRGYQEIYDLLGVTITERGESFYNPMLPGIVEDLTQKGLVEISDGAKCIFCEEFQNREGLPMPLMIQKADGGYNYDTTDVAAMRHRITHEKADRIIITTDAGQSLHFQLVEFVCKKAGYLDPTQTRFNHVGFGLVLRPDGKKFQTRAGDTERLIDLLTTAIDKAKEILHERNPHLSEEELGTIGQSLGIAAVKYADLSSNRISDYVFSYDRMLRFEGNTAGFLMYAYVRIAGIKRKVNKAVESLVQHGEIILQHPSEIALSLHLQQFIEVLGVFENDLLPHRLTEYLYTLAEKFHAFFRDCRVEGSLEEESRLLLCEAVARTLEQGFKILGIRPVVKM